MRISRAESRNMRARAKTKSDSCLLISTTLSLPRFLGTTHIYTAITEKDSYGEASYQKLTLNPAPSH
jgi:hypothetical protein